MEKMLRLPIKDTPVLIYNMRPPRLTFCLQLFICVISLLMLIFLWSLINTLQTRDSYSDTPQSPDELPPAIRFYQVKQRHLASQDSSYSSHVSTSNNANNNANLQTSQYAQTAEQASEGQNQSPHLNTDPPQLDRFLTSRTVLERLRQPLLKPTRSGLICPQGTLEMMYVISNAKNLQQRIAIRQTWGQQLRSTAHAKMLFLVGRDVDQHINRAVKIELALYDDILVYDVEEHYELLTQKTLSAFGHALAECVHVPYLIKCDDDMLVNFNLLDSWIVQDWIGSRFMAPEGTELAVPGPQPDAQLSPNSIARKNQTEQEDDNDDDDDGTERDHNVQESDDTYSDLSSSDASTNRTDPGAGFICYWLPKTSPYRTPSNKWYLPTWVYPESHYPAYCNGPFYILRNSSLPSLMAAAENRDILFLEDVHFTGLLRVDAGSAPILHLPQLINFARFNDCAIRQRFTTHAVKDPNLMRKLWRLTNAVGNC